ncbi:hypothetical protein DL768_007258 [Monosporascus sp. mg162]|nr:hypothetical protein DL768_007258 [Monosporascus sp. mg162]
MNSRRRRLDTHAALTGTPAADSGDIPERYFDCSSLSGCAGLIRTWSAHIMNHNRCSRGLSGHTEIDSSSSPLPKRCIRIGSQSSSTALPQVNLEETDGKLGSYICLTHRWKHPETLATATTTTNYQERLSGSNFQGMSKLFQDLFRLAALLGIKYAWVDSLCIIQDVADDWKEESLKMSNYYQNAEFTVIGMNISHIDGLKISQQHMPLESLPMARLPYRNRQGEQNASLGLEFHNAEEIYSAWQEIVEQYSKLELSRPREDRIIALSGVATEFQKALIMEDDCVAGLWRHDLHQELLWEKLCSGTPRRFDNFPTWSWASIDAPVKWPCRRRKLMDFIDLEPMGAPFWARDTSTIDCVFTGVTRISDQAFDLFPQPGQASAATEEIATTTQLPNSIGGSLSNRRHVKDDFVLHVSGRLQPVLIGSYFENDASFYLATDVTGHPAREIGAQKQRAVTMPAERDIIAGWASLEHPEFQEDAAFNPSPVITALLISTKRVYAGTFGLGFLSSSHEAFLVLFLLRSDKLMNGFERIGVGRLFGREAARGFELATQRDIRLI